jgi:hypothetical protein
MNGERGTMNDERGLEVIDVGGMGIPAGRVADQFPELGLAGRLVELRLSALRFEGALSPGGGSLAERAGLFAELQEAKEGVDDALEAVGTRFVLSVSEKRDTLGSVGRLDGGGGEGLRRGAGDGGGDGVPVRQGDDVGAGVGPEPAAREAGDCRAGGAGGARAGAADGSDGRLPYRPPSARSATGGTVE